MGNGVSDTTSLFNVEEFDTELVRETLEDVFDALEERGYDPVNQLVGYLISADPGYISSHREARKKVTSLDRVKIIEVLLRNFLKETK